MDQTLPSLCTLGCFQQGQKDGTGCQHDPYGGKGAGNCYGIGEGMGSGHGKGAGFGNGKANG